MSVPILLAGSPPRVRGEAARGNHVGGSFRITPACAGRRGLCDGHAGRDQDHPRVCGEKAAFSKISRSVTGSPPRVRGEAIKKSSVCVMTRITPACAGRSDKPLPAADKDGDHPRVCGEKLECRLNCVPAIGSPPRVRGEEADPFPVHRDGGITPACAGRSGCGSAARGSGRDHPRVCGEKPLFSIRTAALKGSPPRVRGEARFRSSRSGRSRITPACAGRSCQLVLHRQAM